MKIAHEHEILKPPEEVFPWIAEPEKAMRWQKNVKGGEIIVSELEIVGTTFKEIIEENGKSLEMDGVITRYVKNELIGFHIKSKIHEFDISYSVEPVNGATKLSIEAIIEWKFPMNIVSLFAGKRIKKGLIKQLESEVFELKRICEAGQS